MGKLPRGFSDEKGIQLEKVMVVILPIHRKRFSETPSLRADWIDNIGELCYYFLKKGFFLALLLSIMNISFYKGV